jgi:hypothetical protein
MLGNARMRAVEHGVPFDLHARDIWPFPNECPILGKPFASPGNGVLSDNSPSLDRLIPSRGYVRGNVLVISHKANRIKNNATPDELRAVSRFMKFGQGRIKSRRVERLAS